VRTEADRGMDKSRVFSGDKVIISVEGASIGVFRKSQSVYLHQAF
jgi:hypothetical protein